MSCVPTFSKRSARMLRGCVVLLITLIICGWLLERLPYSVALCLTGGAFILLVIRLILLPLFRR